MPGILTRDGRQQLAAQVITANFFPASEFAILLSRADFDNLPTGPAGFAEATFGGYAQITRGIAYITGPVLDGDDYLVIMDGGEPFVWDCTSDPETIYGWALLDVESGLVFAAEKYDTPHVLEVGSRHTLYISLRVGQC